MTKRGAHAASIQELERCCRNSRVQDSPSPRCPTASIPTLPGTAGRKVALGVPSACLHLPPGALLCATFPHLHHISPSPRPRAGSCAKARSGFCDTPPHPPTSQHLHIFCPQILVKGSLFIACIDHRVLVKGLLCIASDSWGHQKSCGGKERQEEGGSPDNTD